MHGRRPPPLVNFAGNEVSTLTKPRPRLDADVSAVKSGDQLPNAVLFKACGDDYTVPTRPYTPTMLSIPPRQRPHVVAFSRQTTTHTPSPKTQNIQPLHNYFPSQHNYSKTTNCTHIIPSSQLLAHRETTHHLLRSRSQKN